MAFPTKSSAYGVWYLSEVRNARRGNSWPEITSSGQTVQFPSGSTADGIWSLKQQRRALLGSDWPAFSSVGLSSDNPATASQLYAAGQPAGIYWHPAIAGSDTLTSPFKIRYKPYNNKGWINTFISSRSDVDADDSWTYSSSAGWAGASNDAGQYWLKNVELGADNLVVGSSTTNASILLLGPNWGATDWMCTSVNTDTEENLVAEVSGNNSGGALPLIASQDLADASGNRNSQVVLDVKARILDYFTGVDHGFDFTAGSTTSGDTYQACWDKAGPNGDEQFGMLLHHRSNSAQSDHWHIAASNPPESLSSTYHANIGYRGTGGGSYDAAFIGSWAHFNDTGAPDAAMLNGPQRISTSNAISIWMTNM